MSYEGLFNDYFFDTGDRSQDSREKQLFCPSYSIAITKSQQQTMEYYMTVGLNSNLTEETFKRNPMNLVICIDKSGSMSSPFDRYHYDRPGPQTANNEAEFDTRSKMSITNEVISKVFDHLKPNDRVAIVTFDSGTSILQPMKQINGLNMEKLKSLVATIRADGGTNMSAAFDTCGTLFEDASLVEDQEYNHRILFLTDAQPNQGYLNESSLNSRLEQLAQHRIYLTFVGVGIDFNTNLISSITKHRGANYFSVHNSKKFLKLLDEDFDLILTPLVFNVQMKLQSDIFDVERVYGSPEWDETKRNELIKINTLFPSRTDDDECTRGGVVLLKLKVKDSLEKASNTQAHFAVTYEDRLGKVCEEQQMMYMRIGNDEVHYDNLGIRKAILLVNYAVLLKKWITYERERYFQKKTIISHIDETNVNNLSEWERQSTALVVSDQSREMFKEFLHHFQTEMEALNDKDLEQEVKLLKTLIEHKN